MLFVLSAQGALQTLWSQSYLFNNVVMMVKPLRNQVVKPERNGVVNSNRNQVVKPTEISTSL
jgi:hypothetical protein